jgi:pilus assembly protein Flp/PilA
MIQTIKNLAKRFDDDSGVTAVEYGLITALISVAIVSALTLVGTNLSNTFNTIASKL